MELLLGQHPRVATGGELRNIWERSVLRNELCGCGVRFHSCPFWTEVGATAFDGWSPALAHDAIRLREAQARLHHRLRRTPSSQYATLYADLYAAIAAVSGCSHVIDSSKSLGHTMTVAADRPDLRSILLTRDALGVTASWAITVERPHEPGTFMEQRSRTRVALDYAMFFNVAAALAPRLRIAAFTRYEALCRSTHDVTNGIFDSLGLQAPPYEPLVGDDGATRISLLPQHAVGGNPSRFRTGPIRIAEDASADQRLSRWHHRVSSNVAQTVCRPALRHLRRRAAHAAEIQRRRPQQI